MKVIVNYPTIEELKNELENKVALFHATLVVETIKKLDVDNNAKKKIISSLLEEVKKNA